MAKLLTGGTDTSTRGSISVSLKMPPNKRRTFQLNGARKIIKDGKYAFSISYVIIVLQQLLMWSMGSRSYPVFSAHVKIFQWKQTYAHLSLVHPPDNLITNARIPCCTYKEKTFEHTCSIITLNWTSILLHCPSFRLQCLLGLYSTSHESAVPYYGVKRQLSSPQEYSIYSRWAKHFESYHLAI